MEHPYQYPEEVTGRGQTLSPLDDEMTKAVASLRHEREENSSLRAAIAEEILRVNTENSELRAVLQSTNRRTGGR